MPMSVQSAYMSRKLLKENSLCVCVCVCVCVLFGSFGTKGATLLLLSDIARGQRAAPKVSQNLGVQRADRGLCNDILSRFVEHSCS